MNYLGISMAVFNPSHTTLTESQLHLAVEQLRTQHPNTVDLYKAVAALLFFQYDSTPTTNRLYQLVRKGSMSAPAEALRLFWQELRDRSQLRMEQADIPQGLKQAAGTLIAQIWEESLQQALQITEKNNQAIYTQIALAEKASDQALDQSKRLQEALFIAQQQLKNQDEKIEVLDSNVHQKQLLIAKQEQQMQNLNEQKQELQLQHEKSLLALKEQNMLSEQRAVDMEKYARLEIDRVRQEALKTQQQDQQKLALEQKKTQELQLQYQSQQQAYIELQQQHRFQQSHLQALEQQHIQLEQKNQDLHALLHQLQKQLSLKTGTSARHSPSRLAQVRNKTKNN